MPRKIFNLRDDECDFLQNLMKEKGFKSEVAALHFIFDEYKQLADQEVLIERAIKKHEEDNIGLHERLRWSTRTAEQNSIIMVDILNTLLFHEGITECILTDVVESPVIGTSRKQMKDKIAHFKQQKDNREKNK